MVVTYDKIGSNFNRTRKADEYLTRQLFLHLNPKKGGLYLDIGCGTGNYTNEIQKKGFKCIGIDPSVEMLEVAKFSNEQIDWRIGTAENTGLRNNQVDGIIGSLTIHHWSDLNKGFSELYRILKDNGNVVIFTSSPIQMKGYWLNHYFPKMLSDSIIQMPSLGSIESAMTDVGFAMDSVEKYSIKPDLQDKFLYSGKHTPEIYFDEKIRYGISSFSSLSNESEAAKGLANLRKDIDSGKIDQIINSYENDLGDYLFITGEKSPSING